MHVRKASQYKCVIMVPEDEIKPRVARRARVVVDDAARDAHPRSPSGRLRALADALDLGESLYDLAARFRIPIRALHRVITPKNKYYRPATSIGMDELLEAVKLVRTGKTVKEVAAVLRVSTSTLAENMLKHGFPVSRLRTSLRDRSERLRLAAADYQDGIPIAEICLERQVSERALYTYLNHRGIALRQIRQK